MRSAAAIPTSTTCRPASACGRSRCSTSDVSSRRAQRKTLGGRQPQAASLCLWRRQSESEMKQLRGCAGLTFGLGLSVSILSPALSPALAQGAVPADTAKIEAGETVYGTYCAPCHGDRLVSSGQFPNLRRLTPNDRARFESTVRDG